jgi:large subunit ribosomal protein L31
MKQGIHPPYHQARVVCACGETFETGSTKKEIRVEICSKCHPFYTGARRLVDSEGRVQRFARKYGLKV